jgi:hypothetical protein
MLQRFAAGYYEVLTMTPHTRKDLQGGIARYFLIRFYVIGLIGSIGAVWTAKPASIGEIVNPEKRAPSRFSVNNAMIEKLKERIHFKAGRG